MSADTPGVEPRCWRSECRSGCYYPDVCSERTPDVGLTERERLGRLVREVWIEWAREQPDPKPSWLVEWDDLPVPDREVDRRIGERLVAAERERADTLQDALARLTAATTGWRSGSELEAALKQARAALGGDAS